MNRESLPSFDELIKRNDPEWTYNLINTKFDSPIDRVRFLKELCRVGIDFETIKTKFYASRTCETVWAKEHVAYRCKTCGVSESSCICVECFDPKDHQGHEFRMYKSSSGGCCDCGDPMAWDPKAYVVFQ